MGTPQAERHLALARAIVAKPAGLAWDAAVSLGPRSGDAQIGGHAAADTHGVESSRSTPFGGELSTAELLQMLGIAQVAMTATFTRPPSTSITVPCTNAASSLAR